MPKKSGHLMNIRSYVQRRNTDRIQCSEWVFDQAPRKDNPAIMCSFGLRRGVAALAATVLIFSMHPALSQGNDQKPAEQARPAAPAAEPGKEPRKVDEIAEAAQQLGGPAGQPECVWFGERVVSLMRRDDLDTAFRHLDLYERFGCPGAHVQASFRCVLQQGDIDLKTPQTLQARVHACWLNPSLPPAAAAAAAAAAPAGTTNR
jgi:hypothetical protein